MTVRLAWEDGRVLSCTTTVWPGEATHIVDPDRECGTRADEARTPHGRELGYELGYRNAGAVCDRGWAIPPAGCN